MIALVTGATSGIGNATALLLAKNKFDIIITGRRDDLLKNLAGEIETLGAKVLALNFDIRDHQAVKNAIANLPEYWKNIDVLVNNAGLASGLDLFYEADTEDWEKMIDTNIKGLLYISREITPLMVMRETGHIVNISSIAGWEVYEKGHVYCATKHGVEALTRGMRIDLVKHNIKVSSIAPGMVETEFSIVRFHGDQEKAKNVYKGIDPLAAADIADAVLYVVTRPKHVCIDEILIMPTAQAGATVVNRKI